MPLATSIFCCTNSVVDQEEVTEALVVQSTASHETSGRSLKYSVLRCVCTWRNAFSVQVQNHMETSRHQGRKEQQLHHYQVGSAMILASGTSKLTTQTYFCVSPLIPHHTQSLQHKP